MTPTKSSPVHATISGIMAVLFAAACWASSGIFVKLILAAGPVSALFLAFWRDTFAFVVFITLALCFDPRQLRIRRKNWPWVGTGVIILLAPGAGTTPIRPVLRR